jgi:hypothetical protein
LIEKKFGLHQFDLMLLDSNVMQDKDGLPLCHFTPFPTPGSAGAAQRSYLSPTLLQTKPFFEDVQFPFLANNKMIHQ